MIKNVLLVHGFNGIPKIFEYFKEELEYMDYNVIMPNFPVKDDITVDGYFEVFDKYKKIFNEDLIVIAHSIGNAMLIKFLSKNQLKIGKYISLAGFSKEFYNEGKDILNDKVKLANISLNELNDAKKLINKRYSIYSDNDHIVPYELLKNFCKDIDSIPMEIKNIGHMGKKSGLEKLPEVIEIIKY